ncbi:MAG TPA: LytTR family DNA-binding domain-containing protein [Opitutaceae bacterium]|jgi:two-component system LytT family response regulator|nr:LytTR family DNA-binding domain-containing protein [Opitutaceae bacterium]
MKVLIVDDERLARDELRELLAAFPDVEVVAEAANGAEARRALAQGRPEVIFLDVQMPEENGLELLESLDPPLPQVVFVTAHDEFAVKAFELNAADYLLKPVDPARLAAAMGKVRSLRPPSASEDRILAREDRIFVREGDRCWFVEVGQIRLLESVGSYTRIHFSEAHPQFFRSLNAIEVRLDPRKFFRANRSQIINLDWIAGIEPWFSGGLLVELRGGPKIELSRRQAREFRKRTSL